MNVRDTFLKLTSKTYPYGTENQLIPFLPEGCQIDEVGNYFIKIGESNTLFTCHLDTCCSTQEDVTHIVESKFVRTDGTTILGADDKAGMTVLLYMIENKVPGLYYFFVGEEVGCIGSSDAANHLDFSDYQKCISFDRRGYDSVVTDQFYGTCCSDEFASELAKQLNSKNLTFDFKPDPTGVLTDSASFMESIAECTNISVGYFNEHRSNEEQDLIFLDNLCKACVKVDWEKLPIVREPGDLGYYGYNVPKSYKTYDDWDDWDVTPTSTMSAVLTVWVDGIKWVARLTDDRLEEEKRFIKDWAIKQGYYPNIQSIDWDGKTCTMTYSNQIEYLGEREDLMYMIGELHDIPVYDLELIERV
jgi:hypothetical protein